MNAADIIFIIIAILFIGAFISGLAYLYSFTMMVRFIYSSTNNLFLTITIVASIIFLAIAVYNSTTPNFYGYSNKGFMESGGLYYIISGVLFLISFIINLLSKRSTPRINTSRINTSRKI